MQAPQPTFELTALSAVSPLDGRYWTKSAPLSNFFSEHALIRYRVLIEVEYFLALTKLKGISEFQSFPSDEATPKLRALYDPKNFTVEEAEIIKKEEAKINHDVKAVEYYVKNKLDQFGLGKYREWVHFSLTSQDINNTAIPLLLKDAVHQVYLPTLNKVLNKLESMAREWIDVPMLAHTHGQPATPTRVGKEIKVFHYRVQQQLKLLSIVPHSAKFGGATGQFNAHVVALKNIDWLTFADEFVASLGLEREQWTTQISNYDNLGALQDAFKRINIILMGLCKDFWQYISMEYFKQRIVEGEVGSSAMPHKVNPIDFENAEGNFGIANSLFEHFSNKLPVSRLQRDLTDSTVLRNLGVPLSHTIIAFSSLEKGLGKLVLNADAIKADLNDNYIVISEAIQTVLRRENFDRPYEQVKKLTRTGSHLNSAQFDAFVDGLEGASTDLKAELKQITPFTFIGVVPKV